ncbi:hypothetical protein LOD99_1316 [Oopsacas minuta]|uniref:Uncharacterized protein n=1 Tax=Oopsacas minuta TaxID=111878 RepID=A0AAV7K6D0_9METZ|nr:hypothetical protein LOD99_1316 [Oopsacas minuta]
MRLIRKWPKLRRRVIIFRRIRDKVYWYCRDFKEEFITELEVNKEEKVVHLAEEPLYYRAYLYILAIPPGLRDAAISWKTDYEEWATFRDKKQLEFTNFRKEIQDLHTDNKQDYNMSLSVVVRMIRDSIKSFLQGYNEAIAGKPFPYEEVIKSEQVKEKKNFPPVDEKDRNSQKTINDKIP